MGNSLTNSPLLGGGLNHVTRFWKIPREESKQCLTRENEKLEKSQNESANRQSQAYREQEECSLNWSKSMTLGLRREDALLKSSHDDVEEKAAGGDNGTSEQRKPQLHHWLILRHYETGQVVLYVDGYLRAESHASFRSTLLKLRLSPNQTVQLRVNFNQSSSFAYNYECRVLGKDGKSVAIPESNEILEDKHDPKHIQSIVTEAIILTKSEAESARSKLVAKSSSGIVQSFGSHEPQQNKEKMGKSQHVVMYQIKTVLYEEGTFGKGEALSTVIVLKRFSDFVKMYHELKSAFCGTHLYSNVPNLPPKQNKLFSDHFNPLFIERRKQGLSLFLRKVLALPRAAKNPDVRMFLGLTPELRGTKQNQIKQIGPMQESTSSTATESISSSSVKIFQTSSRDEGGIRNTVSLSQGGNSSTDTDINGDESNQTESQSNSVHDLPDDDANAGSFV